MDNNAPCPFQIKLSGPSFSDSNKHIDLYDLATTLMEFHKAVDKTYCVLTNQQKLSPVTRKQFQIITKNIASGSLLLENELIINNTQLLLPMVGLLSPKTIWEYTAAGFKFLKTVCEFFHKDKKPAQYTVINPVNCTFISGSNNLVNVSENTVTVGDQRVLDIAAKTRPHYNAITKALNSNGIETFHADFFAGNEETIALDFSNKGIFKHHSIIDKNPLSFTARIIDFNTEKKTGKLRLLDVSTSTLGTDYSFNVIGDQDVFPYIEALKYPFVQVTALAESALDPVRGLIPIRFQLIDVERKLAG